MRSSYQRGVTNRRSLASCAGTLRVMDGGARGPRSSAPIRGRRRPPNAPKARPRGSAAAWPSRVRRRRRPAVRRRATPDCACAATCGPTASSHRPNTPAVALAPSPFNDRTTTSMLSPIVCNPSSAIAHQPAVRTVVVTQRAVVQTVVTQRAVVQTVVTQGPSYRRPSRTTTVRPGIAPGGSAPAVVITTCAGGRCASERVGTLGVELREHVVEQQAPAAFPGEPSQRYARRGGVPTRRSAARPATPACAPGDRRARSRARRGAARRASAAGAGPRRDWPPSALARPVARHGGS